MRGCRLYANGVAAVSLGLAAVRGGLPQVRGRAWIFPTPTALRPPDSAGGRNAVGVDVGFIHTCPRVGTPTAANPRLEGATPLA